MNNVDNSFDEEIIIMGTEDKKWKEKYEKEKDQNRKLREIIYASESIYIYL